MFATYTFRLICLPLWALLALLSVLKLWMVYCKNYVLFGSESIVYTHKEEQKKISDIYYELRDSHAAH